MSIQNGHEIKFKADVNNDGYLDTIKAIQFKNEEGNHFTAFVEEFGGDAEQTHEVLANHTATAMPAAGTTVMMFDGALRAGDDTPGEFSIKTAADGDLNVIYADVEMTVIPSEYTIIEKSGARKDLQIGMQLQKPVKVETF